MTGLDALFGDTPEPQDPQQPSATPHLDRLFQAPEQEPPPEAVEEPPERTPSRLEELIRLDRIQRDQVLTMNFAEAVKANPELAGEAQRLGIETGLNPLMIEDNIDKIRELERQRKFESTGIDELTPELRKRLESDPFFARIAHDGVGNLGVFERLAKAFETTAGEFGTLFFVGAGLPPGPRAQEVLRETLGRIEVGVPQGQRGILGARVRDTGRKRLTGEEQRQLDIMDQTIAGLPAESPGFISGLGNTLAQMTQALPFALEDALAGASTLAVGGTLAGPGSPVTVPTLAALGASVGGTIGIIRGTATIEGGNIFLDLMEEDVPAEAAGPISGVAGVIIGGLEAFGVKLLTAPFREMIRKRVTKAVTESLVKPVIAKAAARRAAAATGIVGGNIAEEIAQEYVGIGAELAAGVDPGDIAERIAAIAWETFMGVSFLGIGPTSIQFAGDLQRMTAAQQNHETFERLVNNVKEDKTLPRNPDSVEEFYRAALGGEDATTVYIDGQEMTDVLRQEQIPVDELERVLPGITEQLETAVRDGGDVVIPASQYLAKLAGTKFDGVLRQDLRLNDAESPSLRDVERAAADPSTTEEVAKLVEEEVTARQEFDASGEAVQAEVLEQIQAAGLMSGKDQKGAALMFRELVKTQAARSELSPEEFAAKFPLKVRSEQQAKEEDAARAAQPELAQERVPPETAIVDEQGKPQVLFHQTTEEGAAGIREEGFDVTKVGARATDAQVPNGIFLKTTEEDIGVAPGEAPVQEPVFASITNPLEVADRNALETILREDERYATILDELEALDRERATKLTGLKEQETDDSPQIEAFVAEWREAHNRIAARARGRASKALLDKGHDGLIIEKDEGAGGREIKTVIAFRPSQVQSTTEEGIFRQEARGGFRASDLRITLNKDSEFSTWAHELSHYYVTVLGKMALDPNADVTVREDMDALLEWLGVESLEAWDKMSFKEQQPLHEQIANNYEIFIFTGEAPSRTLEKVFQRIRSWMVRVYQVITAAELRGKLSKEFKEQFGVELPEISDEVRTVFNRMLATEKEVTRAEAARSMLPMFQTQEESGMSDARWGRYQEALQLAHEMAVTDLSVASLRQMQWLSGATEGALAALQRQHDKVRRETRKEVAEVVAQEPRYLVQRFLRTGKVRQEDGTEVEAEGVHRMDTELARALLPGAFIPTAPGVEGAAASLKPIAGMTVKGGLPPDTVADMFGFSSGQEMVNAILQARPLKEEIDQRTDERMVAENAELVEPAQRQNAVDKALHTDARARFVAVEWKFLTKATQPLRQITAAAKLAARDALAKLEVRRIRPRDFAGAEARAAKEAEKASKAAKPDEAIAAKRKQMLQNQTAKEAAKVREEIDKALAFFKRLRKPDSKLAKTRNVDFIGAARAILAAHDLGPAETAAAPHMDKVAEYNAPLHAVLEPMVAQATRTSAPWQQLTLEEFRVVRDTVEALWENSRRDKVVQIEGQRVEVEVAVDDIVAALNPPDKPPLRRPLTDKERKALFHQKTAWLRRVESWAVEMDGGRPGAVHKFLFNNLSDRHNDYVLERARLSREVSDRFKALDMGSGQKIAAPELNGFTFNNKADLIGALRNAGNESNLRKMLLGHGMVPELEEGQQLDTSPWWAFIDRMIEEGVLTKQDFDYVQFVWDTYESLLPRSQEAHFEVYGFRFEEIPATPIENALGEFRGGYVPVVFDRASREVRQDPARGSDPLVESSKEFRQSVSASRGFTFSRVEFNKPLRLDARLDANHLDEHLRFLHMQAAAADTVKLLRNPRVAAALAAVDPKTDLVNQMLLPWVDSTVHNKVIERGSILPAADQFLVFLRRASGLGIMFGNLKVGLQQITGLGLSAQVVPLKYLRSSLARMPFGKLGDKATAKSKFMQIRIREKLGQMRDDMDIIINPGWMSDAKQWTVRHGFFMQQFFQTPVDIITWDARYEQAVAEGLTETQAIAEADSVVRTTQGSGRAPDLSRLEKSDPLVRLILQFSNFWFTAMNLVLSEKTTAARAKRLAGATFFAGVTAGVLTQALKGGWSDDDDDGSLWDDIIAWLFGEVVGAAAAIVAPVVGPIAVQAAVTGEFGGRVTLAGAATGQLSAAGRATQGLLAPLASLADALLGGEFEVDTDVSGTDVKDVSALLTLATGFPFTQIGRSIGYAVDVGRGEIEPTGPLDLIRGLATGTASPASR